MVPIGVKRGQNGAKMAPIGAQWYLLATIGVGMAPIGFRMASQWCRMESVGPNWRLLMPEWRHLLPTGAKWCRVGVGLVSDYRQNADCFQSVSIGGRWCQNGVNWSRMASECCQLSPELRQMVSIGVGIVIDWRRMVPIGVKWCQNGVNWRQLWSNGANWRQMVSDWCQMVPGWF